MVTDSYIEEQRYPEMRTPPLIRILDDTIPRVAGIEGFYRIAYYYIYIHVPALQTL